MNEDNNIACYCMYLLSSDMTSMAIPFIQLFVLMSSLMAESITQESWRKVPSLVISKAPPESRLWHIFRIKGVVQCGLLCGQDDHCNGFQYSLMTSMCSGFHVFRALGVTDRSTVSYVKSVACQKYMGYLLHTTSTGTPLCFKYFLDSVGWQKARERCHADGAELIVLDSEEKDAHIVQYLKRYNHGSHIIWVGMVKEERLVYKWLNNSTHIRWGFNEPDVNAGQHCGQLDDGGISDMYCSELRRFICEKYFT